MTGLTAVPPLWIQLAQLKWPEDVARAPALLREHRRAHAARDAGRAARRRCRRRKPFLMYGLTEAFRSTYLPPDGGRSPAGLDRQGDSERRDPGGARGRHAVRAGRAGRARASRRAGVAGLLERPGEDRRALQARCPAADAGLVLPEIAVWSGDTVRTDDEGFLYFIGRRDEMIKTSGYRVSPTEVEEVRLRDRAGRRVRGVRRRRTRRSARRSSSSRRRATAATLDAAALLRRMPRRLPAYMVPAQHRIARRAAAAQSRTARSTASCWRTRIARRCSKRSSHERAAPAACARCAVRRRRRLPARSAACRSTRLAERVGRTPFYAYDRGADRARVAQLRAALPPGCDLHYAMKANPMPAVVGIMAALVDGLDVASARRAARRARRRHAIRATSASPGPARSDAELRAGDRRRHHHQCRVRRARSNVLARIGASAGAPRRASPCASIRISN